MLTTQERIRALLGNIKNWSWDIYPQFKLEKEDGEAVREYIKDLEDKLYLANQRIHDLEGKMYLKSEL